MCVSLLGAFPFAVELKGLEHFLDQPAKGGQARRRRVNLPQAGKSVIPAKRDLRHDTLSFLSAFGGA